MNTSHTQAVNSAARLRGLTPQHSPQSYSQTPSSDGPSVYSYQTAAPQRAPVPKPSCEIQISPQDDGITKTLHCLMRASVLARSCHRNEWDFAVAANEFHQMGIGSAELRWLMVNGWVEHGIETTAPNSNSRTFQPTNAFRIGPDSCFKLSGVGVKMATDLDVMNIPIANRPASQPPVEENPSWDSVRHELRVGRQLVKKFKWRAQNQEAILCAFQEEEWPARIDDPLPPVSGKNPKRRLSDAIKCLNRHQANGLIRFSGDGTGEGVLWELTEPTM